ncbi:MAG: alanine racemase [Candidatus Atribacteria bacterium]|nr:alanine racemase [Candidatus Atribacteria bacterium]
MFLPVLKKRNPELIRAAVILHQEGKIPPNTWVIDLDTIAYNAEILAQNARKYHLTTYVMSKQHARNPMVNLVAIQKGLYKTVAVDIQCAKIMHRYRVPVGHIGHLNQIPQGDLIFALGMEPDVVTIYSVDIARALSDTAKKMGKTQDLLIRVVGTHDQFFIGQEGGIPEEQLGYAVHEINKLSNVQIVGVTSFPCIRYNRTPDIPVELTENFYTILRAAETLKKMGIEVKQINAPGNTSSDTFELLASYGATHVEPGHGLLGTTPNHAFKEGLPEKPSYLYLTEVSHSVGNDAYVYGGGFWSDIHDPNHVSRALTGTTPDNIFNKEFDSIPMKQIIDYHGVLKGAVSQVHRGDTVVFGFRTQMQMTRSYIAVLSGVSQNQPQLEGLFDHAGTMITFNQDVIPTPDAIIRINKTVSKYK